MNIYIRAAVDTLAFIFYIAVITVSVYWFLNHAGFLGIYLVFTLLAATALWAIYSINLMRRRLRGGSKE